MKKCTFLLLAALLALILPVAAVAAETDVAAMIDALPTVEEFKAMDSDAQLEAYNRTQAAYDAYMALPQAEKAALKGAEDTFEALFNHYNTLIAPAGEEPSNGFLAEGIATALAAIIIVAVLGSRRRKAIG